MSFVFRVAFVASLAATPVAGAQTAGLIESGTRIRVERADEGRTRIAGTLVSRTADTVLLALGNGGLLRLPTSGLRGIDVWSGKSRLAPALKWAIVGGVVWGGVAAVLPLEPCTATRRTNCGERSDFVIESALAMAMITGVIGAIRGEDTWARIERQAATGSFIRPGRDGVAVGFQLGL